MNWALSFALFSTVTWYIWADNFPLMTTTSRGGLREKVLLIAMIPMVCITWGLAL